MQSFNPLNCNKYLEADEYAPQTEVLVLCAINHINSSVQSYIQNNNSFQRKYMQMRNLNQNVTSKKKIFNEVFQLGSQMQLFQT